MIPCMVGKFAQIQFISRGSWSNKFQRGAILGPSPPRTGTNLLQPLPLPIVERLRRGRAVRVSPPALPRFARSGSLGRDFCGRKHTSIETAIRKLYPVLRTHRYFDPEVCRAQRFCCRLIDANPWFARGARSHKPLIGAGLCIDLRNKLTVWARILRFVAYSMERGRILLSCCCYNSCVEPGAVDYSNLSLKKNLNASRPSEHPQSGIKTSKRLRGIIGCKYKTSSWYLNGFPDGSNTGSTV